MKYIFALLSVCTFHNDIGSCSNKCIDLHFVCALMIRTFSINLEGLFMNLFSYCSSYLSGKLR